MKLKAGNLGLTVALLATYNVAKASISEVRGRSITMTWTELAHVHRERNPRKGNYFDVSQEGSAKVYVSDKGRLFGEAEMAAGSSGKGRWHRA